ncbi:MAG TPA: DUF6152 family protein [Gammaproteobacteria bacterium]|nr:DUF6152 family protein [Gammaproteobacteria bacterium]
MQRTIVSIVGFAVLLATPAVFAHHSFAAQFDANKPVTLEGTVTNVEWRNPHIWVYLDVKGADGAVTAWECEGGAPNALTRLGWNRETLRLGGKLTIQGYLAKDGSNVCNARTWTYDGKTVFAGSADGGPTPR